MAKKTNTYTVTFLDLSVMDIKADLFESDYDAFLHFKKYDGDYDYLEVALIPLSQIKLVVLN